MASLSITLLFVRLYHYHDLVIESHSIAKFSSLFYLALRPWVVVGGGDLLFYACTSKNRLLLLLFFSRVMMMHGKAKD